MSVQILQLMDSLKAEQKFSQKDFDFMEYYDTFGEMDEKMLSETAFLKA